VLICFLHEDISVFLELFSNEAFLEVVHTIAPYLLYYYAVALIINQ
jgi:translation initiation factor 3 subunit E